MPVGTLPEAAIDYIRARRELKLQETLLESMVRQFEIAKLDEAKEGPGLQQVDVALAAGPQVEASRALIVLRACWRRCSRLGVGRRASLRCDDACQRSSRGGQPGTAWSALGVSSAERRQRGRG